MNDFKHVPMAIIKSKEVDMPYGLWEKLQRIFVDTWKNVSLGWVTKNSIISTRLWKNNFVVLLIPNTITAPKRPHV